MLPTAALAAERNNPPSAPPARWDRTAAIYRDFSGQSLALPYLASRLVLPRMAAETGKPTRFQPSASGFTIRETRVQQGVAGQGPSFNLGQTRYHGLHPTN